MKQQNDLYQEVTDKIVELIEQHQLHWNRPWVCTASDGLPARNITSHNHYRGVNQFLLSMTCMVEEYPKNAWLSFKQAKEFGGNIIKGSKASKIYYYKTLYYDGKNNRVKEEEFLKMSEGMRNALEVRAVPMLKYFNVFNVFQTEELPKEMYHYEEAEPIPPFERDAKAEALINATNAEIIHKAGNKAYYVPIPDHIVLPKAEQFIGQEPYYATALHELGHWTGHPTRLDRPLHGKFGSVPYSKEELCAELTSAFLCAHLGFEKSITNNSAYLKNWLSSLKKDAKYIFQVASQAQKASDFIIAFQQQVQVVEA